MIQTINSDSRKSDKIVITEALNCVLLKLNNIFCDLYLAIRQLDQVWRDKKRFSHIHEAQFTESRSHPWILRDVENHDEEDFWVFKRINYQEIKIFARKQVSVENKLRTLTSSSVKL